MRPKRRHPSNYVHVEDQNQSGGWWETMKVTRSRWNPIKRKQLMGERRSQIFLSVTYYFCRFLYTDNINVYFSVGYVLFLSGEEKPTRKSEFPVVKPSHHTTTTQAKAYGHHPHPGTSPHHPPSFQISFSLACDDWSPRPHTLSSSSLW
jgi:hypothetical protein